jgi:hypothetical protein
MSSAFSVSQLADAVTDRGLFDDPGTVLRQLRHWSALGILRCQGAALVGQGKHRRYDRNAVFVAAVLVRMAANGTPASALKALSTSLEEKVFKHPEGRVLWEAAINGDALVDLSFRFIRHPGSDTIYQADGWLAPRGQDAKESNEPSTVPITKMHLTELFNGVGARLSRY